MMPFKVKYVSRKFDSAIENWLALAEIATTGKI
jgi:hypothetical protein